MSGFAPAAASSSRRLNALKTTAAATSASPAATRLVVLNAWVYASPARDASSPPPAGRRAAICVAAPMDSSAGYRRFGGNASASRSMEDRYTALLMLPRTAMPNAPPTSRVVSLTADPTPDLA